MSKTNKSIGVNVYAYNSQKPEEIIDLFTSHPAEQNVFKRKQYLIDSIAKGTWPQWSGQDRRRMIQSAKDNGWIVGVRLVMFEQGVELTVK